MECTKLQTLETFPSNSSMPCLKAVEPFLFLHQTIAIISLLQWSRKQTKQDSCIHICFNVSWVSLEGNFSKRMVKRDEMNEMPKGFPFFYLFSWYIFRVLSPSPTFPFYFFADFFACLIKSERYCVLPPHLLSLKQTHATPHTQYLYICGYTTQKAKRSWSEWKGISKGSKPLSFQWSTLPKKSESISISQ